MKSEQVKSFHGHNSKFIFVLNVWKCRPLKVSLDGLIQIDPEEKFCKRGSLMSSAHPPPSKTIPTYLQPNNNGPIRKGGAVQFNGKCIEAKAAFATFSNQ